MTGGGWMVELDGVLLSGAIDIDGVGTLSSPPDGLGLPGLRTEDIEYFQRDGSEHFSDWYEPRILTMDEVTVDEDDCEDCPSARARAREIMQAWKRRCDDVELVIFTDCNGQDEDRSLVGPFGMIGRPRVATISWLGQGTHIGQMLLRFDGVDHRLYILDEDGTPGSGGSCVTVSPPINLFCRQYDRCYEPDGMCYDVDQSTPGSGPQDAEVDGTLCAYPTITLEGNLTNPRIENATTGQFIEYNGLVVAGSPVIIDTSNGTATENGSPRTDRLSGSTRFRLDVGTNTISIRSAGIDDGEATICWRPAVESA